MNPFCAKKQLERNIISDFAEVQYNNRQIQTFVAKSTPELAQHLFCISILLLYCDTQTPLSLAKYFFLSSPKLRFDYQSKKKKRNPESYQHSSCCDLQQELYFFNFYINCDSIFL